MRFCVSNLCVSRGRIPLLGGLDFSLDDGDALIVRGPNGVGKTTLLRTIAGLQPPASGDIEGIDESLVYSGHYDGIKPTLTVAENLQFWSQIYGKDGIDTGLDSFLLTDLSDLRAGVLSTGQRRRLALARLVVTERSIWLLDEPTVSLDDYAVELFCKVVRRHLSRGGIVLAASHVDLNFVADTLELEPYRVIESAVDSFEEAFS